MPPTTDQRQADRELAGLIVRRLGLKLAEAFTARKPAVLRAFSPMLRMAARLCWADLEAVIPPLAEAGFEAVLNEFGNITTRNMLEFMARHFEATGRPGMAIETRAVILAAREKATRHPTVGIYPSDWTDPDHRD